MSMQITVMISAKTKDNQIAFGPNKVTNG